MDIQGQPEPEIIPIQPKDPTAKKRGPFGKKLKASASKKTYRYTETTKAAAIVLGALAKFKPSALKPTAQALSSLVGMDVTETAINKWWKGEQINEGVMEKVEIMKQPMVEKVEELWRQTADAIPEKIPEATYKELVDGLEKLTEKHRLLNEKPTEITTKQEMTQDEFEQRIAILLTKAIRPVPQPDPGTPTRVQITCQPDAKAEDLGTDSKQSTGESIQLPSP